MCISRFIGRIVASHKRPLTSWARRRSNYTVREATRSRAGSTRRGSNPRSALRGLSIIAGSVNLGLAQQGVRRTLAAGKTGPSVGCNWATEPVSSSESSRVVPAAVRRNVPAGGAEALGSLRGRPGRCPRRKNAPIHMGCPAGLGPGAGPRHAQFALIPYAARSTCHSCRHIACQWHCATRNSGGTIRDCPTSLPSTPLC